MARAAVQKASKQHPMTVPASVRLPMRQAFGSGKTLGSVVARGAEFGLDALVGAG